ncbi:MAG: CDP-alcohol phosphatidyltransferase family protein [Bacilli bacterium]|nr:CDP-alcohol phosphatidyltransferase family protein [Bacilli bacterium]
MENKLSKIIVNSITMIRIIGTFSLPIASIILSTWGLIFYLICLLLTDAIDGFLARKLNSSTLFGSLLDTIADKLLGIAALAILTKYYVIMILPIIIETLIILINTRGALRGAITESSSIGKIKTWILGIAIVFGFLTISTPELLNNLNNNILLTILNYINDNNHSIMNILASITAGAGLIVAYDYNSQIRKDIKKAKEEGFEIKNIKFKKKNEILFALFDTKFYNNTRNQPLINKIGEINYEKIKRK